MVLMAGMLPGVECARRRRLRQGGGSAAAGVKAQGRPCGNLLGFSKQRSGGCEEAAAPVRHGWTLDSNAREAKERLDQKLRGQRESAVVVKRHSSAGKLPRAGTSCGDGDQSATTASSASAARREVYGSKTGGGRSGWRRRGWFRLGRRPAPEEEEKEECAVCLEELRAGEAVAHLPCAHRFHWGCAVPWVQAASRCPVCRAAVHLTVTGSNQ